MNESYDSNGQSEYDFTVCLCSIHHEDAKNKSNHSFCEENRQPFTDQKCEKEFHENKYSFFK